MADLRSARLALAELLRAGLNTQVIPHPPRQVAVLPTIFFGAMHGDRETQTGGELAVVPVIVVDSSQNDSVFDTLDDYIDGSRSVIDLIDRTPDIAPGVSAFISGAWKIDHLDIGGTIFYGVRHDVELRYG